MKFKKLVKKAKNLFSASKHDKDVKKRSLEKLIEKLKRFEEKTGEKLADTTDPETRKSLERKILVARAKQKKGRKILDKMED